MTKTSLLCEHLNEKEKKEYSSEYNGFDEDEAHEAQGTIDWNDGGAFKNIQLWNLLKWNENQSKFVFVSGLSCTHSKCCFQFVYLICWRILNRRQNIQWIYIWRFSWFNCVRIQPTKNPWTFYKINFPLSNQPIRKTILFHSTESFALSIRLRQSLILMLMGCTSQNLKKDEKLESKDMEITQNIANWYAGFELFHVNFGIINVPFIRFDIINVDFWSLISLRKKVIHVNAGNYTKKWHIEIWKRSPHGKSSIKPFSSSFKPINRNIISREHNSCWIMKQKMKINLKSPIQWI